MVAAADHRENGPLFESRVLELGSTAAGPFCTRLLADFGADVVKIEALSGDPIRNLGEVVDGSSLYAATIARNKRNVALDLGCEEGRSILRRLVPHFDIIVENFRPGTLERWGFGYPELCELRPDLILTRISGFGQTGPFKHRPGYGVIGEAISGLREMIGDPDRPPSRVAIPLTDYITALYGAFGTAMAVASRKETGRGQCIDVALYESAFSFMEAAVPTFEKTGKIATRAGPRLPNSAPNTLFPTKDGRNIHIAALADPVFKRLAGAIGRPELASDARFADQKARSENEDLIEGIISDWTRSLALEELEARLDAASVPASRIFNMQDIFDHELYKEREMLVSVPHDKLGSVTLAGIVPKMSETPGRIRWAGQDLGTETFGILRDLLGLSTEQLAELAAKGVIQGAEPNFRAPAS